MDKTVFYELKEELESLKTFNKKLVDEVNDLKRDKNDDERVNHVKKMVDKKDIIEDEDKDSANKALNNEVEGDVVEKCVKSETNRKCEDDDKTDENLASSIKEIFDAARVQETIVESLPEPPDT